MEANPQPLTGDRGEAPQPDPRLHGTTKMPTLPIASGPNPVADGGASGVIGKVFETLTGNG